MGFTKRGGLMVVPIYLIVDTVRRVRRRRPPSPDWFDRIACGKALGIRGESSRCSDERQGADADSAKASERLNFSCL